MANIIQSRYFLINAFTIYRNEHMPKMQFCHIRQEGSVNFVKTISKIKKNILKLKKLSFAFLYILNK
jgi:hypothetical protein